ncbi:MAG: hypothetical protein K2X46_03475 [Roseomonas sp.]|nr:hypothetical protein [Roseomonas sp.]
MVRISVELPDEVAEALGRLAHDRQSTPETLLAEAAHDFIAARSADGFDALLADPEAFATYLAPARADVAAGRVTGDAEVFVEMDAIVAAALARKAG